MAPWSFEWVGLRARGNTIRLLLWFGADLVMVTADVCTGWMTGLRIYDKRSLNRRRRRSSSRRGHLGSVGPEGVT
jgi:hypothetical protein